MSHAVPKVSEPPPPRVAPTTVVFLVMVVATVVGAVWLTPDRRPRHRHLEGGGAGRRGRAGRADRDHRHRLASLARLKKGVVVNIESTVQSIQRASRRPS
jgi:hypothetical protein